MERTKISQPASNALSVLQRLLPKVGPEEAGKLLGDTEHWRNFARRIQRNPAVIDALRIKQQHRCPVCQCGLDGGLTVHHVSYINRCRTETTIELVHTTQNRADRRVMAPPCEGCPEMNRCLSFLALVHNACHVRIHDLERRQS